MPTEHEKYDELPDVFKEEGLGAQGFEKRPTLPGPFPVCTVWGSQNWGDSHGRK